jgi:hypothetical protein
MVGGGSNGRVGPIAREKSGEGLKPGFPEKGKKGPQNRNCD